MVKARAPGQLVVTFGQDELDLLQAIERYSEATGASKSAAAKKFMEAGVPVVNEKVRVSFPKAHALGAKTSKAYA
jgi:hypothetical protein